MHKVTLFLAIGCFLLGSSGSELQAEQKVLGIQQCIQIALRQNSQLRNAERRVRIAGAGVTSAWSFILPVVNSSFSGTRTYQSEQGPFLQEIPVGIDPVTGKMIIMQKEVVLESYYRNTYSGSISLSQNIFDGGQWWNRIKQANAEYRAAEYDYHAIKQAVITEVTQKYFELLKAIKLEKVYQKAAELAKEQLKKTQSMYEVGVAAQVDVYKAQVSLGTEQINLIQQRNRVDIARSNLNVVLGRSPGSPLEIADEEIELEPFTLTLEDAIRIAVQNNPEVMSYQENLRSSDFGVKVAKGNYWPKLRLNLSYGRFNTLLERFYKGLDRNYQVSGSLSLSFNIFNGFQTRAAVEQASVNYAIAKENLLEKQRAVQMQVEQAYLNLKAYQQIARINEQNLKSAEEDLRLAQESYKIGSGTLLEVIDAQVALTRARTILVGTKYDGLIALVQLYSAMGTIESKLQKVFQQLNVE